MFCLQIFDWINNYTDQAVDFILQFFFELPGILRFLVLVAVLFLAIIGLIRVASKALKTVVTVASVFLILLIVWMTFLK